MAVAYLRNPKRYRNQPSGKATKSDSPLEPDASSSPWSTNKGSRGDDITPILLGTILGSSSFVIAMVSSLSADRKEAYDDEWYEHSSQTPTATRTAYPLQFETKQQGTEVACQSPSGRAATTSLTYMSSRHEKMLKHFNFQTVLPDKSNANAAILRQEQEDTTRHYDDDDDASVIQKAALWNHLYRQEVCTGITILGIILYVVIAISNVHLETPE